MYEPEEKKNQFEIRTDLAVEEKESFPGDGGEIHGVSLRKWSHDKIDIHMTEVKILDEQGAKAMGKPVGTYITLEADNLPQKDEDYHREISAVLSRQLGLMISQLGLEKQVPSVLVVGLGNSSVTPDALGPKVLHNLQMTRHLNLQYGEEFCDDKQLPVLSGIVPGVMAQTGMETSEIISGVVRETEPDILIAIDALAARTVHRLGTTIQLTDTGIHPGSGVGNHRNSLTKQSMGIPVIAIGVPTVVGAAAIVYDTVSAMITALAQNETTKGMGEFMENMVPEEQYDLIRELLEPEFGPMYVTPPDIDETITKLSFTISEGIHMAFFNQQDGE